MHARPGPEHAYANFNCDVASTCAGSEAADAGRRRLASTHAAPRCLPLMMMLVPCSSSMRCLHAAAGRACHVTSAFAPAAPVHVPRKCCHSSRGQTGTMITRHCARFSPPTCICSDIDWEGEAEVQRYRCAATSAPERPAKSELALPACMCAMRERWCNRCQP